MITEGYLVRHYQGKKGGRGPALIDIAQDHLLFHLMQRGLFDLGIALKGGTAIRKLWAGSAGRFSTDLDFAGVDDATADLLLEAVDGARVGPFVFGTEPINATLRVRLLIDGALGSPDVPARLDLGRRPLWSKSAPQRPVPLPIHARYGFELPAIPAATAEEVIAEKLARFRRTSLARDLHDLAWFAGRPFDDRLVRRMTVLKVWTDVIDDGLGAGPFDPEEVLRPRPEAEFKPEAIGYLTTQVDIAGWLAKVTKRYAFLRDLDVTEAGWARCNRGDEWAVRQAIAGFGTQRQALPTDRADGTPRLDGASLPAGARRQATGRRGTLAAVTPHPATPRPATTVPRRPVPAAEAVDRRFSTRIYYRRPIAAGVQRRLSGFMAARTTGPLGSQARFELLAATADDRRVLRRLGTRHATKNATGFVVGAVQAAPRDLEDYGYLLEEIVLCATGLGLGTCWLGGTFRRSAFVRRFGGLQPGETMPAVVATGYGSEDGTARVRLRKENDRRLPAGELFFDGRFGEPLTASRAGRYAAALEAVRMGPSNRNAQPWRIVRGGGGWHFYLQRTDGSGQGDIVTRTLRIADLERVALGIAMCHFELVARDAGPDGRWIVDDPGLDLPYGVEYSATWRGKD